MSRRTYQDVRCPVCLEFVRVPLQALPGLYDCPCGKRRFHLVWLTESYPGLYDEARTP